MMIGLVIAVASVACQEKTSGGDQAHVDPPGNRTPDQIHDDQLAAKMDAAIAKVKELYKAGDYDGARLELLNVNPTELRDPQRTLGYLGIQMELDKMIKAKTGK